MYIHTYPAMYVYIYIYIYIYKYTYVCVNGFVWKQWFSRDLNNVSPECKHPGSGIPRNKFSRERRAHVHDSENPFAKSLLRIRNSETAQNIYQGIR